MQDALMDDEDRVEMLLSRARVLRNAAEVCSDPDRRFMHISQAQQAETEAHDLLNYIEAEERR